MTTAFIEKQFPVSKISKESLGERKAVQSQTLTGLGKWWGRKPLVLVRAALLGCLMPASDHPGRDMEIFLKIMSMDDSGLWLRHKKREKKSDRYWEKRERELRHEFDKLGYDEKLKTCVRPEQCERPSDDHAWNEINHHLGTKARSLQEVMRQLSEKRFGKIAVVGDCFCGGGSIPFEAARTGLSVYASDLNPIAGLLTWAGIRFCEAGSREIAELREYQKTIYDAVDRKITELGIEHNEKGDRATAYLYCVEAHCPECGTKVPMSSSWLVGKNSKTVARLVPNGDGYEIAVQSGATEAEMRAAKTGTVTSRGLVCPHCHHTTPIAVLRRDGRDENGETTYGLRRWEKSEFESRPDDVFQERLYCVRYEKAVDGRVRGDRYYRAPDTRDLANEEKIRSLVSGHIVQWQQKGFVPGMAIESGYNTDQLVRERGWTHWNHLFNARQLLLNGLIAETLLDGDASRFRLCCGMLSLHRCCDWNSKLCRWGVGQAAESSAQTFYNQALNTLWNYGARGLKQLKGVYEVSVDNLPSQPSVTGTVDVMDARDVTHHASLWITDPPYADAVNYHELLDFFLAWDKRLLPAAFPDWHVDGKRILAVRGGDEFSQSMIEIYSNLTRRMPDDGMQVVMFTHSDPSVWAQLAIIMWKSGLKVTAAWNIATETEAAGLKEGNYVRGTVLLVLRKRTETGETFLDEINADIKNEVVSQIESMQRLDDKEDPNFSDPDYVLAAYAASLKVLTGYGDIGELDLDYELDKAINDPKNSRIVALIERAKRQAYDCVLPVGFDGYLWKELTPSERFYVKGLENEKHGDYKISTYQEYARGFALGRYGQLMANERANTCRLKTPTEFAMRTINEVPGFEDSVLRLVLAAIHIAIKEDDDPDKGLSHLKNGLADYWGRRDLLKQLLLFLKAPRDLSHMPHWAPSARMAEHLYVLVDNDHV